MACDKYSDLLPLYAAGHLEKPDHSEITRHLVSCPDCAAEIRDLATIIGNLAKPIAPPLSELDKLRLENGVLRAALHNNRRRDSFFSANSPVWRIAAAIVLVCLGFAAGSFISDKETRQTSGQLFTDSRMRTAAYSQISASDRFTPEGIKLLVKGAVNLEDGKRLP